MKKTVIHQWAEEERPREKMISRGAGALINAKLLAILIGSGNQEESAVELMRRILASCNNNLSNLGKLTLEELCAFKGVGEAKALSIMASSELGWRRTQEKQEEVKKIDSSQAVYDHFYPLMADLLVEECWILLLSQGSGIIDKVRISSGGFNETAVDLRCIFRETILRRASSLILCHNHPSEICRPSAADDTVTEKIKEAGKILNIPLLDHVIVCGSKYYSYADEGRIL